MVIVVTGLDGSGTSTIANKICELDSGAEVYKTPSREFSNRHEVDERVRRESAVAHLLYYLSSTVYISDYIKNHCDYVKNNIYIVRYLIDTVVSNRVAGIPIDLDYKIYGNDLLVPDLTLFLNVNETERQKRLSERGKDSLDVVLDDVEKRKKFLEEYNKLLITEKNIFLNNDADADAVADKAYKKILTFPKK